MPLLTGHQFKASAQAEAFLLGWAYTRHCERSEAIQKPLAQKLPPGDEQSRLDCFALLAMTAEKGWLQKEKAARRRL